MIRLDCVSKSFGKKAILKDGTFHFPAGERVALVGANGAGKTTLLNLICKLDEPDNGTIIRPKDCVIGYLPQEPNPHPCTTILQECVSGHLRISELLQIREAAQQRLIEKGDDQSLTAFEKAESEFQDAGGPALESRARGILAGLGFHPSRFDANPKTLSGGWRMRLELAKVFLNDPDFLVLDEPTNHLDLPSLIWVEAYLKQFEGCVVFVSHDRGLLNRLATMTLHLSRGQLRSYKGNFDSFLEQKESLEQQDVARAESIARRKAELTRFVERFGAKATKARQAQARVKMLARLQDLEDEIELPQEENSVSFTFPEPSPSGRDVLQIEKLGIGYNGSQPLAQDINLNIIRGQKICIIGANGIGKSTLLQTLSGQIEVLSGGFKSGHQVSLAYFAQDQLSVLDPNGSVLENVLRRTNLGEREARSLLGSFLFHGDDVFKKVSVLSGGEKNRVGLAILLSQNSNFLLLDEPTNHLDMSSAEILSEALQDFQGTILCVSHDREFINSFANHIFVMLAGGRYALFQGNLDDYPRLAAVSGFPNILDPNIQSSSASLSGTTDSAKLNKQQRADAQALKREKQKLQRRLEELEKKMEALSAKLAQLEDALQNVGSNYQRAQELTSEQKETSELLVHVESEWMSCSELMEQYTNELGGP